MVSIRILQVYCYIQESVYTRMNSQAHSSILSINVPRIYANNGLTFITQTHIYVDKAMKWCFGSMLYWFWIEYKYKLCFSRPLKLSCSKNNLNY